MSNSMSYKGYTASMVFDAQDKVIVGRVLDIDDIISFHSESVSEFESNFHAAIEGYLAASKELGSAAEKPASGKVMLRIAPEVHAAALKAAARSGTSLNKWAERALGTAARKPLARATARSEAP
jgi:predicted HicB family RNase H-like nuclease